MTNNEYWAEAFANALEELNIDVLVQADKAMLEAAGGILAVWSDNHSMAFGSPSSITLRDNPEARAVQERIERLEKELEETRDAFRRNFARRHNIAESEVHFDDSRQPYARA